KNCVAWYRSLGPALAGRAAGSRLTPECDSNAAHQVLGLLLCCENEFDGLAAQKKTFLIYVSFE
ncbi:MAG: hypothetical protein WBA76_10780, partial [Phormidesmis sp.]